MDKLSHYLLSANNPAADGGKLSFLAKRASNKYVEDGVELSEAVSDVLEGENLTRDQIKRVCEDANKQTFRSLFEKQADKNVQFPLADYREVMGKEEAVPSRAPVHSTVSDAYVPGSEGISDVIVEIFGEKSAAQMRKTSNVAKVKTYVAQGMSLPDAVKAAYPDYSHEQVAAFVQQHGDLAKEGAVLPALGQAVFGATKTKQVKKPLVAKAKTAAHEKDHPGKTCVEAHPDQTHEEWAKTEHEETEPEPKEASAYGYEVPESELIRTRERLQGVLDHAVSKLSSLQIMEKEAQEDLHLAVEQVILQGGTFHGTLSAVIPFVENEHLFKTATASLTGYLLERGTLDRGELAGGFDKVAGRRCPNPDHPVVTSFRALQDITHHLAVMEESVKIAAREQLKVSQALGVSS